MSRSKLLTLIFGFGIVGLVVISELISSSANGIGPYQAVLLALGIGILIIGFVPTGHWIGKIGLMFCSVIVTLMLIEGVLMILTELNANVTYPDVRTLVDDDVLGKRTPSDAPGHDEEGWRNEEVLEHAEIVVIGDSQTWGVNAPLIDSYPNVLGEITGKSVYSMAQGSYGAVQYHVLTEEALDLTPELIIVGMYFGNDLADAYTIVYGDYAHTDLRNPNFDYAAISQSIGEQTRTLIPSGLVNPNPVTQSNERDLTFMERVQSGTFIGKFLTNAGVFEAVNTNTISQQIERNTQIVDEYPDLFSLYNNGNVQTFLTPAYRQRIMDFDSPMIAEGILITKDQYLEIMQLLDEENIELLVVLIPTKEYVYLPYIAPDDMNDVYQKLGEQEKVIRDDMMALFEANGIAYIDTLSALQEAVENNVAIYPSTFDGHPDADGYQVIAEAIAEYLQENSLIK